MDKDKASLICSICLLKSGKNKRNKTTLDCGHIFHSKCINPWIFTNPTCPICRKDVLIDYRKEYKNLKSNFIDKELILISLFLIFILIVYVPKIIRFYIDILSILLEELSILLEEVPNSIINPVILILEKLNNFISFFENSGYPVIKQLFIMLRFMIDLVTFQPFPKCEFNTTWY